MVLQHNFSFLDDDDHVGGEDSGEAEEGREGGRGGREDRIRKEKHGLRKREGPKEEGKVGKKQNYSNLTKYKCTYR